MSKTQEMKKLRQNLAKLNNEVIIGSSVNYSNGGAFAITIKFLNGSKLSIKPDMLGVNLNVNLEEVR